MLICFRFLPTVMSKCFSAQNTVMDLARTRQSLLPLKKVAPNMCIYSAHRVDSPSSPVMLALKVRTSQEKELPKSDA